MASLADLLNTVGDRVRAVRKGLGLTQEQLAERAGLNTSYVGQIERGLREPSLRALFKVAAAVNLEIHELLQPGVVDPDRAVEMRRILTGVPGHQHEAFLQICRDLADLLGQN